MSFNDPRDQLSIYKERSDENKATLKMTSIFLPISFLPYPIKQKKEGKEERKSNESTT